MRWLSFILLGSNQIDKFRRSPLDQRRYKEFVFGVRERWGSVKEFVRGERLGWKEGEGAKGKAFQDPGMWLFT